MMHKTKKSIASFFNYQQKPKKGNGIRFDLFMEVKDVQFWFCFTYVYHVFILY